MVETQSLILGAHCPQREGKKQEAQLSLTMDLPVTSQDSKGLIQSPGSPSAASRETRQDMFRVTADMSVPVLDKFVCLCMFVRIHAQAYCALRHCARE